MNVLILGSGGREHSLAWAVRQNPKCRQVFVAPGNDGMKDDAICLGGDIDICDAQAVLGLVKRHAIDFVIVGPEAPLAAGICDDLRMNGILCFGPGKAGAMLEKSKAFTKALCDSAGVPTARYRAFADKGQAEAYIRTQKAPIVVKADGLAAGKGVYIAEDIAQALQAVEDIFATYGGQACEGAEGGARLVVEEYLEGEEASFFVLVNGADILPIGTAQDHKRAYDGDRGPNTGGMGAYSPSPIMDEKLCDEAVRKIIRPTLAALAERGISYQGVLYAGVMIKEGRPYLIEYNVRFGDPECQVLMMRLGAQALDVMLACAKGALKGKQVLWADDHALTIVMAAKGYPKEYAKGEEIKELECLGRTRRKMCFSAALRQQGDKMLSAGGRVLNLTACAETLKEAHKTAYEMARKIDWSGGFFRTDIGAWAFKDEE